MAAGLEAMTDTVGRSEGTGRGATRGEGGATRVSEPIGVEGARGDIAILPGGPPGAAVPKGSGLPRGAKAGTVVSATRTKATEDMQREKPDMRPAGWRIAANTGRVGGSLQVLPTLMTRTHSKIPAGVCWVSL